MTDLETAAAADRTSNSTLSSIKTFSRRKFLAESAADFGGIEERDTALDRLSDEVDALLLAQRMIEAEIQSHAAEADR
jgi:hypothetical protein